MVSRSVEEASAVGGGGGMSNGFSGEGDALMRRERDHFFRSLKRSMPLRRSAAMPMKMRGTDHFFRTLRSSLPDETNHFFREKNNGFVTWLHLKAQSQRMASLSRYSVKLFHKASRRSQHP